MQLLRIGSGDEVILPSISFVGAGNAIVAAGAKPVFCDVDPRTLNATADYIDAKISDRTKAVLLIHYGGYPARMDDIIEVLDGKGIALIEDRACSVASTYRGKSCGTLGQIGVWSFDAMKILVTGDGGMMYVNSPELARRAEKHLYLGLTAKSGFTGTADSRWWEFDIECFGRRSIMNDVASAVGLVQLAKLQAFIARRKEVHGLYDAEFADIAWLQVPPELPIDCASSFYFYWIQLESKYRDRLAQYLRNRGIYTTFRYFPLHRINAYGADSSKLPNTESAAERTLCLPLHQGLSNEDVATVIEAIRDFAKSG